jgi:hypothetical protein
MHKKYGKDGLAAVSVNTNDPKKKGERDKVLEFLNKHSAAFTNLMLKEDWAVWHKKLGVDVSPAVLVFDRDGKLVKKFDDIDYKEVEKFVVELLSSSPNRWRPNDWK